MSGISNTPNKGINSNSGQIELDTYVPVLQKFFNDGIDFIYDLEPQSNNLFYVGEFTEEGLTPGNNDNKDGSFGTRAFYNAAYHIKSIDIKSPQFSYKIDPNTKAVNLDQINYPQEVTIEWMEDVYHSVKKYHMDWMSRWYNRQFDVLRCGIEGKFRRCRVIAFHFVNENVDSLIEVPKISPMFVLDIGGMAPKSAGDFKFDYGADGNDSPLSISYNVSIVNLIYSNTLGIGRANFSSIAEGTIPTQVWSPTNFSQDSSDLDEPSYQRIRVTRSLTSHIVGEGQLG